MRNWVDIVLETVVKLVFLCECDCEFIEHVLLEFSKYTGIYEEIIINFNGFLQNNFHLKSSFE